MGEDDEDEEDYESEDDGPDRGLASKFCWFCAEVKKHNKRDSEARNAHAESCNKE